MALVAVPTVLSAQAARPAVLQGVIRSDSGRVIAAASVFVTRGPDRMVQTTIADSAGRWSVRFAEGFGDYLVYARAPGYGPARRRVTDATTPPINDTLYTVSLTLTPERVQTLATVEVRGARRRPTPPGMFGNELIPPGAVEAGLGGFDAEVPPDLAGDLRAQAAQVPGAIQGGFFGLGTTQSAVALGGIQTPAGGVPRDLRTLRVLSTSTMDPARGWFGASETAVELSPGLMFLYQRARVSVDAPALQVTDAVGRRTGAVRRGVTLSGAREHALRNDRITYSIAGEYGRRGATLPDLATASPAVLGAAGLDPDSIQRLLTLLDGRGVPVRARADDGLLGNSTSDRWSVAGRIGSTVFDYDKGEINDKVTALSTIFSGTRSGGIGRSPTAAGSVAGSASSWGGTVQLSHTRYLRWRDAHLDLKTALARTADVLRPGLLVPSLEVPLSAAGSDGGLPSLTPVRAGGNGDAGSERTGWQWDTRAAMRWYPGATDDHLLTVTAASRVDQLSVEDGVGRLGTLRYASATDLAADRPANFIRSLAVPRAHAATWNGFASLGDNWRVSPALRVEYGVRLEASHLPDVGRPAPEIASSLGVRTAGDGVRWAILPRAGFRWRLNARSDDYAVTRLGSFRLPRAMYVSGGIGRYRNLFGPAAVLDAALNTGAAGAARILQCTGGAVPATDWRAWSASLDNLPTTCAGGAPLLQDLSSPLRLLGAGLTAPESWRANLGWHGVLFGTALGAQGVLSINRHQPSVFEANLRGDPAFIAADGRAVHVPAGGIDPATGAVNAGAARVSSGLGRVSVLAGDARSVARQLTLTASPVFASGEPWVLSAAWTIGHVRSREYGFAGAFGSPQAQTWARSPFDVRHQLQANIGYSARTLSVALFGRVSSGLPFTPLIGSDVNGDGLVNDMAVVATPGVDATAVSAAFATAPRSVRRCLERLRPATLTRNACEGPWTATLNAQLLMDGARLGLGRGSTVAVNLENPLVGLDALVHGGSLRGWGSPAVVDPVLFRVTGFDPATRRFAMAPNPRFGNPSPAATSIRLPFRVTIDVRLELAPDQRIQQVDKWFRRTGRQLPKPADELKARYMRGTTNPYATLDRLVDSLLLQPAQVRAIRERRDLFAARIDSVWTPVVRELAAFDGAYDRDRILRRQDATADSIAELARQEVRAFLPTVLSPLQLSLLRTGYLASLLRAEHPLPPRRHYFF